jgi:hypothetical protein
MRSGSSWVLTSLVWTALCLWVGLGGRLAVTGVAISALFAVAGAFREKFALPHTPPRREHEDDPDEASWLVH